MLFGARDYSPTELLDLCKVDRFDYNYDGAKHFVLQILALVVAEKNPTLLAEKLERIVRDIGKVSIGQSLERLHLISTFGDELQGGLDGLDALTYHLAGDHCHKGIKALQAVLGRFDKEEEERLKAVRLFHEIKNRKHEGVRLANET